MAQMRGAEGEAALTSLSTSLRTAKPVLVALRTLRNKADAAISARPDPQGSGGTCFGSQGEQSVARRVKTHFSNQNFN